MGSSQSQLSRSREVSPDPSTPPSPSASSRRSIPGFGRRISSFMRRDGPTKRERSNSLHPPRATMKRRRMAHGAESRGGGGDGDDSDGGVPSPVSLTSPETMAASVSPASDPLLNDRLSSISTIREALGPEWPSPGAVTPGMDRLLSRFRRAPQETTASPPLSSTSIQPSQSSPSEHSLTPAVGSRRSNLLGAIMGFGGVAESGVSPPAPTPTSDIVDPLSLVEVAATSSTAEGVVPAVHSEADDEGEDATERLPGEVDPDSSRVPLGAVLVIQGLAQTHIEEEEIQEPSIGLRRSSRRRASEGSTPADTPSLDQQARMIGNLLTVAAAATATTLFSPESLAQQPNRTTAQSAMQTIIERLRPQRARPPQSVEAALGDYLRTVLRDNRRFTQAVTGDGPANANIPAAFQGFLETLQDDLIVAVRAYATLPRDTDDDDGEGEGDDGDGDDGNNDDDDGRTLAEQTSFTGFDHRQESTVPTFHSQRGQNLPSRERSLGVTGGLDGEPRRLNFFRAHLFPPVRADGSPAVGDEVADPDAVVPSIFVGVRSVSHDPGMTTEDLAVHPSFPFLDGQVSNVHPEGSPDSLPVPTVVSGERPPAPSVVEPRRTLRERVLDRFSLRREPRPPAPLNTYLVYVIGGNYPRSHPVLAIPSLATGGPLSPEDLQLVGELLGPAKPPTATTDEIEQSGLRVVKADQLKKLVDAAEILSSSFDRCMICLGDYEPEEDCRILACRHAFHRECVDHWLSQGRNSCPTCRSEAVVKSARSSDVPTSAPISSDEQMQTQL